MLKRALVLLIFAATFVLHASDHLDTPTVIADPAADIGDLYAWTSADGRRLNLVMDIVAHQFSDKLQYVFHVDSGPQFGRTTASTSIVCRFDKTMDCRADGVDATRLRVFAGLRDDPFFNNVRGTRAALNVASAALKGGAKVDAAGCPHFDEATTRRILDEWRHTDGGPGKNFLGGWQTSALVVSIDLDAVNRGGPKLAVWAAVLNGGKQIERVGRPLTKNALIGLFAGEDASNQRKEEYNRAAQKDWAQFVSDLEASLALYDGFDGRCGNAFFADPKSPKPYHRLATILADDRLWIKSKSTTCKQFFALELMESGDVSDLVAAGTPSDDCGGRTLTEDACDVFRSLLATGMTLGLPDGVDVDDRVHSNSDFPFLAPPAPPTTSGAIAVENLDHQIAQRGNDTGVEELLLVRSRFLGDYDALERAAELAESHADPLERARVRAALHRFAEALPDADAPLRASILTATGRAADIVPQLEAEAARHPGYASHGALANAYAAAGRLDDADRMYAAALADLDTTLPFPYAWIAFARGLMWNEQGGDRARGKAFYVEALDYLPQFAAANIHLAEIELAEGDRASATARLERVLASTDEPEALALLGQTERARQRFEALLARQPLAFADHAAEFYLGAGANPARAWELAQLNLANRPTPRAFALAMRAAGDTWSAP